MNGISNFAPVHPSSTIQKLKAYNELLPTSDEILHIPPATQTFDRVCVFEISFDCNSNQLVLAAVNDGIMSSSKECHKPSLVLA